MSERPASKAAPALAQRIAVLTYGAWLLLEGPGKQAEYVFQKLRWHSDAGFTAAPCMTILARRPRCEQLMAIIPRIHLIAGNAAAGIRPHRSIFSCTASREVCSVAIRHRADFASVM